MKQVLETGASAVLIVGIVTAAVTYVGYRYTKATSQKELDFRYVELAVNILMEPPSPAGETVEIRKWAIEVVNHYSEVPIPQPAINELQKQQILRHRLRRMDELLRSPVKSTED